MIDYDGSTNQKSTNDRLNPESREPNFIPPTVDPAFLIYLPNRVEKQINPTDLNEYSRVFVPDCYIVSTGHGTSGPFLFSGVALFDFIENNIESGEKWNQVEVISADGFGTRIAYQELVYPGPAGPIIIADTRDGNSLTRDQGLFRLIVPSERDDAIRQVKWIRKIRILRV